MSLRRTEAAPGDPEREAAGLSARVAWLLTLPWTALVVLVSRSRMLRALLILAFVAVVWPLAVRRRAASDPLAGPFGSRRDGWVPVRVSTSDPDAFVADAAWLYSLRPHGRFSWPTRLVAWVCRLLAPLAERSNRGQLRTDLYVMF